MAVAKLFALNANAIKFTKEQCDDDYCLMYDVETE